MIMMFSRNKTELDCYRLKRKYISKQVLKGVLLGAQWHSKKRFLHHGHSLQGWGLRVQCYMWSSRQTKTIHQMAERWTRDYQWPQTVWHFYRRVWRSQFSFHCSEHIAILGAFTAWWQPAHACWSWTVLLCFWKRSKESRIQHASSDWT